MTVFKASCYDRKRGGNVGMERVEAQNSEEAFEVLYRRGRVAEILWYNAGDGKWLCVPRRTMEDLLRSVSARVLAEQAICPLCGLPAGKPVDGAEVYHMGCLEKACAPMREKANR